jgi:thiamine pyrophosphate-dependent acetolactate synthase large subunit-like protein
MDRREFVARLLRERGDLMVVTGLGTPTFDVAACGDHPLNFYLWGAMGSATMVGLGLALARKDRRVAVITGDGEALMGIGSLATVGVQQPKNLAIVVLDNGHYAATGMQPTHTNAGIDLVAVARACRFAHASLASELDEATALRDLLHSGEGPVFIQAKVKDSKLPRILTSRDGHEIKHRFLQAAGPA